MKIYYKTFEDKGDLVVNKNGDWIDIWSTVDINLRKFEYKAIPLGVAIKLPKHFEAISAVRSSTPKQHGLIMANSIGVIDNSYSGNDDQWHMPALAFKAVELDDSVRLCQFRIQPNQFAPWWVKLKWIFVNKIELVKVQNLDNVSRGGLGTSGK